MTWKNGQIRDQSSPVAGLIRGSLTGLAVDGLPDQVGMAVVPGVLLDHVDDDPAQAERLTLAPAPLRRGGIEPRVAGQRRVDHHVCTTDGLVEEPAQLLGAVVVRGVPL